MKRFLLICLLSLWSGLAAAQNVSETQGQVVLEIEESEEKIKEIGLVDMVETVVEVGEYFNKNYPGDKIYSDLKPDIEKFFPNLSTQDLYDRESFIRKSILLFRWGKEKIDEIKSKLLIPDTPVLTYDDSEYENPADYDYVDVGADKVRVITDIKKVISYSGNYKETESYHAYLKRKEDNSKFEKMFPEISRLKRVYDKIELKKLPFYGIIFEDPKTNGEGIGRPAVTKDIRVRLAASQSRLEYDKQITGIIQFAAVDDWQILAYPYQKYPAVAIDFKTSSNLSHCRSFQPTPQRMLFDDGDLITYGNALAYPFICDITDNTITAEIIADVTYTICNTDKKCQTGTLTPQLTIAAGNGFSTTLATFITQRFTHLPDMQETNIRIKDVSVDNNSASPSGQTLRVIIESKNTIGKPEIFVKTDDNISFARPKIAIDNKIISARIDILTPDVNLIDKPLHITLVENVNHSYSITKTIQSSSVFDINSQKLTLGLILLAVLGGFLLNFMPCVFPVLSLKMMSLTKFGAKKQSLTRRSFLLSAAGIFCGFMLLSVGLSILKIIGRNLGWGMQFQNPIFMITMIFAVLLFLALLHGIINITPQLQKKTPPAWDAFLSGILVVIMSTPCTGPYLGTTIGFALAGSPTDIFVILSAVALGLAMPYLLLAALPDLSVLIPRPGKWMETVHSIMSWMLIITIIWLLSILKAQSSWLTVMAVTFSALAFYFVLYTCRKSLDEAELITGKNPQILKQTRKVLRLIYSLVLAVIFIFALIVGSIGFSRHKDDVIKQTAADVDFYQIGKDVDAGYNVLVKVGADWCLTCSYNDMMVFDSLGMHDIYEDNKIKIINIDWTEYNPRILDFMSEYGRRGLPFYILYNRNIPEGLVLPEVLNRMEFIKILNNSAVRPEETE